MLLKSKITFLEGYLWDEGDPKTALIKHPNSNRVAMSYLIYFG